MKIPENLRIQNEKIYDCKEMQILKIFRIKKKIRKHTMANFCNR